VLYSRTTFVFLDSSHEELCVGVRDVLRSALGSMYIAGDESVSLSLSGKLPALRNGKGVEYAHLH
jgi:hypothetical protein